jgi:hypothetical protein
MGPGDGAGVADHQDPTGDVRGDRLVVDRLNRQGVPVAPADHLGPIGWEVLIEEVVEGGGHVVAHRPGGAPGSSKQTPDCAYSDGFRGLEPGQPGGQSLYFYGNTADAKQEKVSA